MLPLQFAFVALNCGLEIDTKQMHITFVVTLYSCSYGRDDCSLCLAADPQYQCVWCEATDSCVFTKRCLSSTTTCPAPVITQVNECHIIS